jgi:transketolase
MTNWNSRDKKERDRIILSKGHAALALFCVLEKKGVISSKETDTFESNGSRFYAHAKRDLNSSIEFSGGSLSLGISYAVGVALACKTKNPNSRIYVIVGDGECNEGLLWEAVMSASNYNLSNLTIIVDNNGLQSDGFTKEVMNTTPLDAKFKSFGFDAEEIDGHNIKDILKALSKKTDKPKAIVAHTIKGKGVSFMENEPSWHHGVLTDALYNQALDEMQYGGNDKL